MQTNEELCDQNPRECQHHCEICPFGVSRAMADVQGHRDPMTQLVRWSLAAAYPLPHHHIARSRHHSVTSSISNLCSPVRELLSHLCIHPKLLKLAHFKDVPSSMAARQRGARAAGAGTDLKTVHLFFLACSVVKDVNGKGGRRITDEESMYEATGFTRDSS